MLHRRALLMTVTASLAATLPVRSYAQETKSKLSVMASFSILADLVQEVGGERVDVSSFVGPDGDAHVYQPSAADAKRLAAAKLVVVNGLGFEGWIDRLIKASGTKAPVTIASRGVNPLKLDGDDHGHGSAKPAAAAGPPADPHAWQNVANASIYVANIRDALVAADPDGAATYAANAAAYTGRLTALDADVRAASARIPADRKRIITSHDAFGYFAAAYGLTFIAPQGVSTEAEASAKDVARIIRQIRAEKIPAVFLENVSDPRLIDRITRETGAKIGGRLYSDALSAPDGPAGTYIDMMRNNIRELSAALAS